MISRGMSRHPPTILLELIDPSTYLSEQVLVASGLYAVFYLGEPFGLRERNALTDTRAKYKRTSFPEPGHAVSLAARLNARFKSRDFAVFRLHTGEPFA